MPSKREKTSSFIKGKSCFRTFLPALKRSFLSRILNKTEKYSLLQVLSMSAANMDANDYNHFRLVQTLSTQHKIVLTTINLISSLMNISSNVFLLYTVRKLKLGTSVFYRFVVALAISELFIGGTIQPLFSAVYADTFGGKSYARIINIVIAVAAIVLCQFSVLMIHLISLDRYLHMKHLNLYNAHMTRRRGNIFILCNVLGSILLGLLLIFASLYGFYSYAIIAFIISNAVLFTTIIYNYINAYLSVRKRVAAMEVVNCTSQSANRVDLQFAKGILAIMASLAIRYVPYLVFSILVTMDKNLQDGIAFAYFCSIQLVFLGACINNGILFGLNRKLRNFFSSLSCCQRPMEEE